MSRVTLIVTGEYSEYSVVGVAVDETVAAKFCDIRNSGYESWKAYRYQTLEVIEEVHDPVTLYKVSNHFDENGAKHEPRENLLVQIPGFDIPTEMVLIHAHSMIIPALHTIYKPKQLFPEIIVSVEGYNKEAVHKVYSEKAAQVTAEFDIIWARIGQDEQNRINQLEGIRAKEAMVAARKAQQSN